MIPAAACLAVVVFGVVFAALTVASRGGAFWAALTAAWVVACVAFLLVCLVGHGAEMSARWRER